MRISLKKPLSLSDQGQRPNNEDAIYPLLGQATSYDRLFLVCDGVGGSQKGEVASTLACRAAIDFFMEHPDVPFGNDFFQQLTDFVQEKFDGFIRQNPSASGMGTTMTLLCFDERGAWCGHIGDSRIYHIRDGRILFRTEDHSLVSELVQAGVITPEQAVNHPKRNVITRAIQGASIKEVAMDVRLITDLKEGDHFFLCTDGILEQINDAKLEEFIAGQGSNEEKIGEIFNLCSEKSSDNFSCYLLEIDTVAPSETERVNEKSHVEEAYAEPEIIVGPGDSPVKKGFKSWIKTYNRQVLIYLIILIILLLVFFYGDLFKFVREKQPGIPIENAPEIQDTTPKELELETVQIIFLELPGKEIL
jgi:serine/threonine protein phosphatase PrpC